MKKYTVNNGKIVDSAGTPVTLKGVNLVCKDKSCGYIPRCFNEAMAFLAQNNMNVIRLGIFWDAVEPAPGVYDDTYLEKIKELCKTADQNGIAVFLDMHQDLFSSEYEDGAPAWATLPRGESYEKTELWSEAYLTSPAVQNAFDSFWSNAKPEGAPKGLQDYYFDMWKHVAAFFKETDNVIGYDVLNEPFPGTEANSLIEKLFTALALHLSSNPHILFEILGEEAAKVTPENIGDTIMGIWLDNEKKSTLLKFFSDKNAYKALVSPLGESLDHFDRQVLSPFYQNIRNAIREIDNDVLLFIEANYFCNTGVPSGVIPPKTYDGIYDKKVVYSPHGYDLMVDTNQYSSDCHTRLDVIFEAHAEYAKKYDLPVLVGEWGCYPDGSSSFINEALHVTKKFAELGFSYTYYDYSSTFVNHIIRVLL